MIVDTNLPQKIETKLGGEYNVESVINDDGTQTLNITSAGKAFDRLQWKCDNMKSLAYEFWGYPETGSNTTVDLSNMLDGIDTSQITDTSYMFACKYDSAHNPKKILPLFDTSNVTNMERMFSQNGGLTEIPPYDTSNVTNMNYMFNHCYGLTEAPFLNTSKVTQMSGMFQYCGVSTLPLYDTSNVTKMDSILYNSDIVTFPALNTYNVTTIGYAFWGCNKLETIEGFDMIKVTYAYNSFNGCNKLTNLTLFNIKLSLQIGSGTSYGHLLTLDSLINTLKELWDYSSGTTTYKLTMSEPSKELIANVYVKLITPTEEMIANDPNIENKLPCEVCASTDEGAMLITDYATLKMWTIA